jgi:hypothetical protein
MTCEVENEKPRLNNQPETNLGPSSPVPSLPLSEVHEMTNSDRLPVPVRLHFAARNIYSG